MIRTVKRSCGPITLHRSLWVNGILILEAGVVLKFDHQAELAVGVTRAARLIVRGTASNPVILTSADDHGPGAWPGVNLGDRARGSQLAGLVIENAGENGKALGIASTDITMTGSTIRNAKGAGLESFIPAFAKMSGADAGRGARARLPRRLPHVGDRDPRGQRRHPDRLQAALPALSAVTAGPAGPGRRTAARAARR